MHVTTNVKNREQIFKNDAYARTAIETLYAVQNHMPFFLYAFTIMPDHCHFLIKVPAPGTVAKVLHAYKRAVSFNIGLGPMWQKRYFVTYPDSPQKAKEYIHTNPSRGGLPLDYPWSSASGRWDVSDLEIEL